MGLCKEGSPKNLTDIQLYMESEFSHALGLDCIEWVFVKLHKNAYLENGANPLLICQNYMMLRFLNIKTWYELILK